MTRILVVEDEPTIATGLQDDLELEGFDVEVARDGDIGARRAASGEHDLILLDLMLPKKDGFTVCRETRAAGVEVPIIILTAKGQELDKVLGLELGADDYVTKPFSPRELLARIKAVLRRTATSAVPVSEASSDDAGAIPDVSEFGDVKADFGRCQVWRGGEEVSLTAMELKLLRTFLTCPGRVLSLDELIERVWGPQVFMTDRVVYTHINNLRKKIEVNPANPQHLITVRGMGYRFDG